MGARFDIAGTTDASTEGDETINIEAYNDGTNKFNFTITLKDGARPAPSIDSSSIDEGETKTFTVSNIPLSWTGTPAASIASSAATTVGSCPANIDALVPNWDVCRDFAGESWNSGTRAFTFRLKARADSVADDGETITASVEDGDDSSRTVSFTITIDEPSQPTVTITGGAAATEGGNARFTLNINPAPTANLRVDFTVSEETGSGQEFVASGLKGGSNVTVAANSATSSFTVATTNDSTDEPDGSVTVQLTGRTGYNVGTPSSASVAVNDDDAPTLSIGIRGSTSVPEGTSIIPPNVDFPVTLSGPTVVGDVDYRVCFSGTATLDTDPNINFPFGEDYQIFFGGVHQDGNCVDGTIASTRTTPQIGIEMWRNADAAFEPDETVVATLTLRGSPPADVSLGTATATYTILNDDTAGPTVSFSTANYPVWEGDAAKVEVVLSEPRRTDTVVTLHPTPLSATGQGVDFIDSPRPTVTIPRFETRGTGTIRTTQDARQEDKEQFRLEILAQGLPAGVALGMPSSTMVHIQDDDQDPGSIPQLRIARYGKYVPGQAGTGYAPVVEGTAASFTVTVGTDWAAPEDLAVTLEVSEDTGEGRDFVASGNEGAKTMTIHPWRDGASRIFQVPTMNDGVAGPDGAVSVRLVPSDDYSVQVGHHHATVEVVDDDHPRGLILYSSTPAFGGLSGVEGSADGYTVRLASPPTGAVTVTWTRRDDGDGDGDWSNVRISPASMTFTQDDWFVPQTMSVRGDRDNDFDNDRFSVVHTASGGGYNGISGFMRVGVVDNYPKTIEVPSDWALKPSGLGVGDRFRLLFVTSATRTGQPTDIATYNAFVQGRAKVGHETIRPYSGYFKVVGSTAAVGARDNTETNGTGVPIHWLNGVKVADDNNDFYDGSWDNTGSSGKPYKTEYGLQEITGSDLVFTGSRNNGSKYLGRTLGSNFVTRNRLSETHPLDNGSTSTNSLSGRYYGLSPVFEVVAGGGQDFKSEDTQDSFSSQDSDGNFQSDNTPPAACVSDAQWSTVAGYYDSNANRSPNYGANWYRVLIAYRQARPDKALPAWEGAPAQPTAAYTAKEAEDGEEVWSGWTPVREVLECLEKQQTSASQSAQQSAPPPDPELSLSAGSGVDEGASASFTIHADPAPAADVTVGVAVAQSGDYLDAPGAGTRTVTLAAGATAASLAVATVNDGTDEPDGSVSVSLNAGTGYTVASSNAAATVAVRDDDEPVPEVSVSAGGDVAEGAAASFTITASPAPTSALDIDVTVDQSGDFAASGATGVRTVIVPASGSVTLSVATADDGADEPDGSISVSIDAGAGYAVSSSNGTATVAVRDNDDPPPASSCVGDEQWDTVAGYYGSNASRSPNYGANWYRVLIAYRLEDADRALPAWTGATERPTAAYTVKEAEDGETVWGGWTPVRKVLECLRDANLVSRSFVPLVPGFVNPALEGVVRFVNRSPRAGSVRIAATDDAGWRPAPVTLRIGPGGSVELTSRDLERGNEGKGLDGGIGTGTGDWRLDVSSGLDLGVRPFARAGDGALAEMGGVAEEADGAHEVWTFNPAGELAQSSLLRVMNLGAEPATAGITGIDDAGRPGGAVTLEIPARAAVQLTAADLEGGGPGIHGLLGDGHGRWRLRVASEGELAVMNLSVSPFGHLTNLSGGGFPALRSGRAHSVPYVPPASDGLGRLGLVRVINESARGGEVHVLAHDATGRRHGPLTLRLGPGEAAHFDSWSLEFGGEAGSGLSGGTGPGVGAWRLEITSGLDIEVRSYVAMPAGSLRTAREFVAGPGLLREVEAFAEDR